MPARGCARARWWRWRWPGPPPRRPPPARPGPPAPAGATAGARRGGGSPAAALQLPSAALVRQGGGAAGFMQRGAGRYALVPVKQLSSAGGRSVVSGLAPGAVVVVQGTAALLALARP